MSIARGRRLLMLGAWMAAACGASQPPPPSDIPRCNGTRTLPDGGGTWDGGPVRVPLSILDESGTAVFTVQVQVGTAQITALLDTGSSGLRIHPGTVPDSDFACITDSAVTYGYQSGEFLTGYLAYATIALGDAATPAPIPVMYSSEMLCQLPNGAPAASCTQSTPLLAPFLPPLELTNFEGFPFQAILGIGMENGKLGIGNPIVQMSGEPAFVVEGPSDGGTTGTLVIGPTTADRARFATFPFPPTGDPLPNGVPAHNDGSSLPGCMEDESSGASYCLPTLIDTGSPGINVLLDDLDAGFQLSNGTMVQFAIGYPDASLAHFAFDVDASPDAGVPDETVTIAPPSQFGGGNNHLAVGFPLFWFYDVLFDQANGLIGFAPKG